MREDVGIDSWRRMLRFAFVIGVCMFKHRNVIVVNLMTQAFFAEACFQSLSLYLGCNSMYNQARLQQTSYQWPLCLECSLHVARHRVRLCSCVESAAKPGLRWGQQFGINLESLWDHVGATMVAANPSRYRED